MEQRKAEDLSIKIPTEKCNCARCFYGQFTTTPFAINCPKYKIKPSEVLYGNKKCEKFKSKPIGADSEEDYEI